MTPGGNQNAGADDHPTNPPAPVEESPGLPGFGAWRAVYVFVIGSFVLWVLLLALLSRAFS